MEAESLYKSGHPRVRCLDVFLVVSNVFLFIAVGAVTAGGIVVLKLRPDIFRPTLKQEELTSQTQYKMQNFAYLQASSSELQNGTMKWSPIHHGAGQSIGGYFLYNAEQQSIEFKHEGIYFIYLDLKLTCTYHCNAGLLTVSMGDHLNCTVELPNWKESAPVNRKCWTVAKIYANSQMVTQMTVSEGLDDWKLELTGSGQGFLLVD